MKLILTRHGESEDKKAGMNDEDRHLTDKGNSDIKKIAKFIKSSSWNITHIFHSPYIRTHETAKILADDLGFSKELESSDALACGEGCLKILPLLSKLNNSEAIVLVSHNPDITHFAAHLLGNPNLTQNLIFSPGTSIAINVAKEKFEGGQILWSVSPDYL